MRGWPPFGSPLRRIVGADPRDSNGMALLISRRTEPGKAGSSPMDRMDQRRPLAFTRVMAETKAADAPVLNPGVNRVLIPHHGPQVDKALVMVRPDRDPSRSFLVRVADLQDVHWVEPPRGPRRLLHAYLRPSGNASPGSRYERVKVCVVEWHTPRFAFAELSRRATPLPLDFSSPQPGLVR